MEILSPIKNLENAQIAIKSGANAIYLASPNFGARVNAALTNEEIEKIIKFSKSYKVKSYVTFNTVVFNDEIEQFFQQIDQIYVAGADGIIIQDFAMISILKKIYPSLEIHVSTQMHVHNTNAVKLIEDLGAKRVVIPREMNFNKIKKLKQSTNIEIEAFVHGALCVCYSGQCYDSTLLDQKSANRGRCSQYCRMPLSLINKKNGKEIFHKKHILNLRDLNNLSNLNKYQESGVSSLKIEGRLKGIDYVGMTTASYVKKLAQQNVEQSDLSKVYNRTFTNGRISGTNGYELVNLDRPNNTGLKIGEVLKVEPNYDKDLKYYKNKIFLKMFGNHTIFKGDNLRFVSSDYENGQEVQKFQENSKNIILYSNLKNPKGKVYKTKDNMIITKYKEQIATFNRPLKKLVKVQIIINSKEIAYIFKNQKYKSVVKTEKALTKALTKEQVLNILKKTGNTDYKLEIEDIDLSTNIFVPNKSLKQLRDEILDKCKGEESIKETQMLEIKNLLKAQSKIENIEFPEQKIYYFTIKTEEQMSYFQEINKNSYHFEIRLIISSYLAKSIEKEDLREIKILQNKYKIYLLLPRVIYDDEEEEVLDLLKYFNNICISELGSLKYKKYISGHIISNFTFNTTNNINKSTLAKQGVTSQVLSIELNEKKINQFPSKGSVINIYGSIPVMLMDYCPINHLKNDSCGSCRRCRSNNYFIKDSLNREFPLLYEGNSRIGLYTQKRLSLFEELDNLKKFNEFYLNLTLETKEELKNILISLEKKRTILDNTFKGNFYKEVL